MAFLLIIKKYECSQSLTHRIYTLEMYNLYFVTSYSKRYQRIIFLSKFYDTEYLKACDAALGD